MSILFYSANPDPFADFTGDDFTGTNGDPPNPIYWTPGGANGCEIQNNKVRCSITNTLTSATCDSTFELSGDFDVRATLSDVSGYPSSLGAEAGLYVFRSSDMGDNFRIMCDSVSGGSLWSVGRIDWGTVHQTAGGPANDRKIRLRITRTGTLISTWYDASQGDSYTAITTNYNLGVSDPMWFRMYMANYTTNPSVTLDFDDFVIAAGTVTAR
jgi:hypothetical protein